MSKQSAACTCAGPMVNTHVDGNGGHSPGCPANQKTSAPRESRDLLLIGDEWSWEAVIGIDYGRVARADAARIFAEHGIDLPPEGPEEQRFIEVPVSPGKHWEREFEPNPNGQIHGWKVEL